jgi:transcriptional regulator with XRE-family HTH domain
MKTGERITYFRKNRNLTTNKLANMSGLSQSFIRDVELCNKSITVDNLELVCEALKISLQDFFDEPEETEAQLDKDLAAAINKLTIEQKKKLRDFLRIL